MRLFHITPRWNKESILRYGLRVSLSQNVSRAIWLVKRGDVGRTVERMRLRYGTRDIAVLYVDTKRMRSIGSGADGFGFTRDIPAKQILGELAWEG